MDAAETVFDVSLDHPLVRAGRIDEVPHLFDGVLCSTPGPEAVRGRAELRLENRLQHEHRRHLYDPVAQGGNAEPSQLPRPALGDRVLAHRLWGVASVPERLTQLAQDVFDAQLLDALACLAINPGGA